MLVSISSLLGGLLLLVFGGNYMVKHAVLLAQAMKVPSLVIGLTVVAFGTAAPELLVSLNAIFSGHSDIVIGNIIGSNIANLLLVLSLAALIFPVPVSRALLRREGLIMAAATVLFYALCATGQIGYFEGAVLLAGLIGFTIFAFFFPDKSEEALAEEQVLEVTEHEKPAKSISVHICWVAAGLIALVFGSDFFVEGAVGVGRKLGISEAVIGLTVVAFGTSLPEVVTSVIAAIHRHSGLAIGNVLGSNIFNILGIGGITALVAPITVHPHFLEMDLAILTVCTIAVLALAYLRRKVGRGTGLLMFGAYIAYIAALF